MWSGGVLFLFILQKSDMFIYEVEVWAWYWLNKKLEPQCVLWWYMKRSVCLSGECKKSEIVKIKAFVAYFMGLWVFVGGFEEGVRADRKTISANIWSR